MKKNILTTMESLKIDPEIRGLIKQLWKHNYKTVYSCSGHNQPRYTYVVVKKGDGWFETNADKYGLKETKKGDCCEESKKMDEELYKKYPTYFRKSNFCGDCGYAFDEEAKSFQGTLIPNPFNPKF